MQLIAKVSNKRYESTKEHVKTILTQSLVDRLNPIWGLNDEGELNSVFRYSGVPGLYFAMGKDSSYKLKLESIMDDNNISFLLL